MGRDVWEMRLYATLEVSNKTDLSKMGEEDE